MDTNMQVKISIWVQPFNGMCFLSSNSHRWRFKFFGIQCCVAWYIATNVSDEVLGSIFRVVWKTWIFINGTVRTSNLTIHSSFIAYCREVHANKYSSGWHKIWLCTSHFFSLLCHKLILNLIHLHDPVSCKWKKASFSESRSRKWSKTL